MKASPPIVILLAGLAGASILPAATPPVKSAPAMPTGPKTHVLFMGLDLDWQQGTEFHRVRAIRGRSAVVQVGGGERTVGMGRDGNNFKMVNSLKLAKGTATLDKVKLERFYTPENDPQKRFTEAMALSTAMMEQGMVARQMAMRDQYFDSWLTAPSTDDPEKPDLEYFGRRQAALEKVYDQQMVGITAAQDYVTSTMVRESNPLQLEPLGLPRSGSVRLGEMKVTETDVAVSAEAVPATREKNGAGTDSVGAEAKPGSATIAVTGMPAATGGAPAAVTAAKKNADVAATENAGPEWYDAFELKFEVSAEKPLADPYMVIVLNYIDPAKPNEVKRWVHAQQLDPIGPTPRLVRLRQGGLPPGFVPRKPSIHLYDGTRELATAASGGMALTRDEAFEYVRMEYLAKNKQATLPPTAVMAELPPDLPQRIQAGTFPEVAFIEVDAQGRAGAAFADQGKRRRIDDPAVLAVLREVRFQPALEKGKPVVGLARVKLSEIPL